MLVNENLWRAAAVAVSASAGPDGLDGPARRAGRAEQDEVWGGLGARGRAAAPIAQGKAAPGLARRRRIRQLFLAMLRLGVERLRPKP